MVLCLRISVCVSVRVFVYTLYNCICVSMKRGYSYPNPIYKPQPCSAWEQELNEQSFVGENFFFEPQSHYLKGVGFPPSEILRKNHANVYFLIDLVEILLALISLYCGVSCLSMIQMSPRQDNIFFHCFSSSGNCSDAVASWHWLPWWWGGRVLSRTN